MKEVPNMHEALGEEEYVVPFGVHMYTVHGCIKLLETAAYPVTDVSNYWIFESPIFQSTLETYSSYLLFVLTNCNKLKPTCLLIP
jgi:hypothetical protein